MKSFTFHINKKYTVWEQELHAIDAETEEEAVAKMKAAFLTPAMDDTLLEVETMYDTMEEMTTTENDGHATIELQTMAGDIIADNSIR